MSASIWKTRRDPVLKHLVRLRNMHRRQDPRFEEELMITIDVLRAWWSARCLAAEEAITKGLSHVD